jgi:hypothetical protein
VRVAGSMRHPAVMSPIETARALVAERFPDVIAAFLGETVLTARRTATSDLDIVVLVAGEPAPFRETLEYRSWLVELFVHTPASFAHYSAKEIAARRSPLLHMCGRGTLLADIDGTATRIQQDARARLDAGPAPVSQAELEDRRYGLSGLLDDLDGVRDPDELVFIATRLLPAATELVLLTHRSWLGTGKWLVRQLRQTDAALSQRLLSAYRVAVSSNRREPLRQVVQEILDGVGGRLMAGYHRQGEAPPRHGAR